MSTVIDRLDSLRTHLAAVELPELYSVTLLNTWGELNISAQLAAHHPPQIASGLLAWADTLTNVTSEAWRVPSGDTVHLSVIGRLPGDVSIRVYGGMPFIEHGLGAELAPDASTTVPPAVLRHLATPSEVTLS
jgi:hypothetical protein